MQVLINRIHVFHLYLIFLILSEWTLKILLPGIKSVHHKAKSLQMPEHLSDEKEWLDQFSSAVLRHNIRV